MRFDLDLGSSVGIAVRDLDPVLAEYEKVLEDLAAELFADKQIASAYADLDFDRRLCQIYNETGQVHAQHFDVEAGEGGSVFVKNPTSSTKTYLISVGL